MENDTFGFDFSVFDIHLVADKDNGDIVTDAGKITMPRRNILVCDTSSNVEHDDCTLSYENAKITLTFLRPRFFTENMKAEE